MTAVMEGVRILEVAEHTFVPAASAVLADLGADVIKIEHVERGDAMRGLASTGMAVLRASIGFLTFCVAFLLQRQGDGLFGCVPETGPRAR